MSLTPNLPLGFRWSSATAGIKASGRPDVAFAVADTPANIASITTTQASALNALGCTQIAAGGRRVGLRIAHVPGARRSVFRGDPDTLDLLQ